MKPGLLSIVATPIGNLEDITLRALRTLKDANIVFAEDTRVTKKLLDRHGISVPMRPYHQRSGRAAGDAVVLALQDGKRVALVTDAGTPGISDPGNELIARVRDEAPDATIEPIPGASSLTAALSVAGLPTNDFLFLGFLPHKKGRKTLLDEVARTERTVVLFESPHRIGKLLTELAARAPSRRVVIARELTKMFESVVLGSVEEVSARVASGAIPAKGEFVVILGPA